MSFSSPAVLLVSSHPALARQITRLLEQAFDPVQVDVAPCGVAGLTQIYQTPPDLLVVDARLSDMSGLQFCRTLKQDPIIHHLPLVMVTADDPQEYERVTELSPIADAFIDRHNLANDLIPTLQSLLRRFEGLEPAERESLDLLRQATVMTQPLTRMVQLLTSPLWKLAS